MPQHHECALRLERGSRCCYQSFTHALYHLAANPEFIGPLRKEVEAVLQEDGWTKAAMGKMRKLDSFMRESQRMNGINGSMSPAISPQRAY